MLEVKLPTVKRPAGSFINFILAATGALVLTSHGLAVQGSKHVCSLKEASYKSTKAWGCEMIYSQGQMLNGRVEGKN